MDARAESQFSRDNGQERSPLDGSPARTEAHTGLMAIRLLDEESAELLHELNNVFVSVLLNTQVMEWKLPSYSRLKRNLHEVQRNAQRGGELAKRLSNRLEAISRRNLRAPAPEMATQDSNAMSRTVADQEPKPEVRPEGTVTESIEPTAPAFPAISKKVPHTPV